MVSTKPEHISKYGKARSSVNILPHRISYMTPEDKFALQIDYKKKSNEIFLPYPHESFGCRG